ncbi:hypothetical protein F5B21DRAFT_505679 [Xylaria acuta]|nr:hypothetical protein F5B21DRAFT_505679 [Xylaria acuta]
MFIPEFMTAGYLLAISATAPAETQHPNIKPAAGYECLRYPIITATPTPTQPSVSSSPSSQTLPGSCYTTWDDWEHTTATVKTHECYTRTSLVPAGIEHNGSLRDGLLSDDEYRLPRVNDPRLSDVRGLSHPD